MERGYYVDRACELGDQRACNDPFMATVYACTRREHGVSCLELARAWQEGEVGGGPPDLLEAALLYSRACELGQGGGCRHLGLMFRDGEALNASASRAQEYFALGCELGDGAACALLAGP
jgi:TPR repeat protein